VTVTGRCRSRKKRKKTEYRVVRYNSWLGLPSHWAYLYGYNGSGCALLVGKARQGAQKFEVGSGNRMALLKNWCMHFKIEELG